MFSNSEQFFCLYLPSARIPSIPLHTPLPSPLSPCLPGSEQRNVSIPPTTHYHPSSTEMPAQAFPGCSTLSRVLPFPQQPAAKLPSLTPVSLHRSSSLHFSFLILDKYREWLEYLLEFAQDAAPIPNQYDKHFMERDYTGYVLALNGHKKYFCLFKPLKTVDEEAVGSCDPDSSRGKPCGLGPKPLKGKLSKLSLWMERLLEGSLQRFYIPSWPELD